MGENSNMHNEEFFVFPFYQTFSFDEMVSKINNKKLIFSSIYLRPYEFLIDVEKNQFRPYQFINNLIILNYNAEPRIIWHNCCQLPPLENFIPFDGIILIPHNLYDNEGFDIILQPINYLTRDYEELLPYIVPIKDFIRRFRFLDDVALYVVPNILKITNVSAWKNILNMDVLDYALVVVFPKSYLPLLEEIGFDVLLHPEAQIGENADRTKNPFVANYFLIAKDGKVAEYRRDGILLILEE